MKDIGKAVLILIYLALAVPMFYFSEGFLSIGGFGFMYMYLFGMGIIALAIIVFLISPDVKHGALSVQYAIRLAAPYTWSLVYSIPFWAFTMAAFRIITRGFFYVVYQYIAILVAAATLYLFGSKGIYYQFLALALSDVILMIQMIRENGAAEFVSEYIDVIVSVTAETGPIMKVFESTEHCFAVAFFLVYFLLDFKKNKSRLPWFIAGVFLFFLGLKRSVLISAIAAVIIGGLLILFMKKSTRKIMMTIAAVTAVLGVVYIVAIRYGLYDWLEQVGLETSGRSWIFDSVKSWYELGVGYLGRGIGYVSGSLSTGALSLVHSDGYSVADVHNDLLRQYIELGCLGYIVWLIIFLQYRIRYFFHKQETEEDRRHGILTGAVLVTLFVTLMTDNTLYYFYTTMFSSIVIMGYRYEEYAGKIKLPGEESS